MSEFAAAIRLVNRAKDASIRQLANLIAEEELRIGIPAVLKILEEEGISHQDMRRVNALRSLPEKAEKVLVNLSCDHAVTVVQERQLLTQRERLAWLRKAQKNRLTPTQLRRSILAGKIVTNEDVRIASGRGSGLLTIENVAFQAGLWHKHMQKADPISGWEPAKAHRCLEKLKPFFAVASDLIAAVKPPQISK